MCLMIYQRAALSVGRLRGFFFFVGSKVNNKSNLFLRNEDFFKIYKYYIN